MELVPVDSSMISAVEYDAETRTLVVVFNSGKVYSYFDVPPKEHQGLMAAGSKGGYMRDCIISVYPYGKGMPKPKGKKGK